MRAESRTPGRQSPEQEVHQFYVQKLIDLDADKKRLQEKIHDLQTEWDFPNTKERVRNLQKMIEDTEKKFALLTNPESGAAFVGYAVLREFKQQQRVNAGREFIEEHPDGAATEGVSPEELEQKTPEEIVDFAQKLAAQEEEKLQKDANFFAHLSGASVIGGLLYSTALLLEARHIIEDTSLVGFGGVLSIGILQIYALIKKREARHSLEKIQKKLAALTEKSDF